MRYFIVLFFGMFLLFGCKQATKPTDMAVKVGAEEDNAEEVAFPVYDFDALNPMLHKNDDTTYIVNFWATWCKPCVEELPYFEKLYSEVSQDNVELVLVSLDMPSMWKSKLEPFVAEHQLKGKVVILDDPKMNDWIPKIDADWGGGIPATLIYNGQKRQFYPKGFTYIELKTELDKFLRL